MISSNKTATGATFWAYVQGWVARGLSLLLFLALARVLQPVDFGAFQAASMVMLLSEILVEQGLGLAIIQRNILDESHLNTAFWSTLMLGVMLMLGAIGVAYPLAGYLHNSSVASLIMGLSPVFVIGALSSVPINLMRRSLDYKVLTKRSLLANIIAGVVAIFSALNGCGAWTFIYHQLAFQGVGLIVLWYHERWRPKFFISLSHFRDLFNFSGKVVLSKFVDYAEGRMVEIYIGRVLGVAWLGQFSFGSRCSQAGGQLLSAPIWDSSMGILSRFQNDEIEFKRNLLLLITLAVAIALPPITYVMISSPFLIPDVFGPKWNDGVECLQILLVLVLLRAPLYLMGVALQAKGWSGVSLRFNIIRIIFVVLFLIFVAPKNIGGVALGLVVGQLISGVYIVLSARKFIGVGVKEIIRPARRFVFAVLFGGGASWVIFLMCPRGGVLKIVASLVVYVCVVLPILRRPIINAVYLVRGASKKQSVKIVKIIGAFNERNFGDDLLLFVAVKIIKNAKKNLELLVTVPDPSAKSYIHRLVGDCSLVERFFPVPRRCDVQVYAGGNQFYSFPDKESHRRNDLGYLSRFFLRLKNEGCIHMSKRLFGRFLVPDSVSFAIGVGVGPFKDGNEFDSRRVVSGIKRTWIRDVVSSEYLDKWGVSSYGFGADICFASGMFEIFPKKKTQLLRSIGIVARGWHFATPGSGYELKLAKFAVHLQSRGYSVRFYSFCEPVDGTINEFFNSRGFEVVVWDPERKTVHEYFDDLAREDLLISARFHGVVAAALLGIPCFGISLDPKVENICKQLGFEDFVWRSEASYDDLLAMFENGVADFCSIQASFVDRSRFVQCEANKMINEFLICLSGELGG